MNRKTSDSLAVWQVPMLAARLYRTSTAQQKIAPMDHRDFRAANLRALLEWERQQNRRKNGRLGSQQAAAEAMSARLPCKPGSADRMAQPAYLLQLFRGYATIGDARERTPSESLCRALETAYRLPAGWMDRHHQPLDIERALRQDGRTVDSGLENVEPVSLGRPLPIISWVQAGMLNGVTEADAADAEDFATPIASRPGPRAFALRVSGESMTAPTLAGASFPDGTIIIVDPDVAPTAGRFVIAKDVATQEATFKKLVTDAGRYFLQPLNPAFPTIPIDRASLRVIGVVVESQLVQRH